MGVWKWNREVEGGRDRRGEGEGAPGVDPSSLSAPLIVDCFYGGDV